MKVIKTNKDVANYIKDRISQLDYEGVFDRLEKIQNEQIEYSYKFVMFRAMILIWLANRISFCVPNNFLFSYVRVIAQLKEELCAVLMRLDKKTEADEIRATESLMKLHQQIQGLNTTSPVDIALLDRCQADLEMVFWKRFGLNRTKSSPFYCDLLLLFIDSYLTFLEEPLTKLEKMCDDYEY